MIVVIVGDDDSVYCRDVFDVAGSRGVAFGAHEREGGAAVFEHWVE